MSSNDSVHSASAAADRVAATSNRFFRLFIRAWMLFAVLLWLFQFTAMPAVQYPSLIMLAAGLPAWVALRAGRTLLARLLFLTTVCFGIALIPLLINGVRTPVLANIPMLLLMTGWLLGRRAMGFIALVFGLTITAYWFAEHQLWLTLSAPLRTPDVWAMVWMSTTVLVAVVTWSLIASYEANFNQEFELQGKLTKALRESETANSELALSEARWQFALEGAGDGVWDWDVPTSTVFFSKRWKQMLGHTDAEVGTGLDEWSSRVHPEDMPRVMADLQPHLDGKTAVYTNEHRVRCKDGSYKWILDRGMVFTRDAEGRPLRVVGTHGDITERKQAEARLREASQLSRQAELREATRASALTALVKGASLDQVFTSLVHGVEAEHPGTLGSVLILDAAGTHLLTGAAPSLPAFYNEAIHGVAIGPAVGSCGTAAFRGERVVVSDIQTDPLWANYKDVAAQAGLAACWSEPIRNREGRVLGTFAFYFAQAREPGAAEIDSIVTSAQLAALAIELKQTEAEREDILTQLQRAQKLESIGVLAAGIAHDFNNVLATVLGRVEIARIEIDQRAALLESLEEIQQAGVRGQNLVQQIITYGRRQPTDLRSLDLKVVIEDAVRLARAVVPNEISVQAHLDPGTHALADAAQIRQVVINLVTNAMQAILPNSGSINVQLDAVTLDQHLALTSPALRAMHDAHPGGLAARLIVSDTGAGMDAHTLERIFEPFFTTKPPGEGTGMGLAVVYGIAQAHQGAVVAESTLGCGTTFTLYIPAAPADAALVEAGTAALSRSPQVESGLKWRLMYVDDEPAQVSMVTRLLQLKGYQVSGHTSDDDALEALRSDPQAIDLLVTDYNMPGISGLQLTRAARSVRKDLKIAVITGFIDEALRNEAKSAGVAEVILKGTTRTFYEALERLLPGRKRTAPARN